MTDGPVSPPVLLVLLVGLQTGLSIALPAPRLVPPWLAPVGLLAAGVGLWLHHEADRLFALARTTRATAGPPRRLVTDGVFGRSRNPMYLGGAFFLAGLAVALGPAATLAVLPLYLVLVGRWYVGPEERVLADTFGSEYRRYRERVRRWL